MKRQRPPTFVEFDEEDESDEFKPLFDYSETMSPAPTFLSDESDEDDVVITSGPPQLKHPKISPAKEPPTASKLTLDDDDDESWLMPSPTKLAPKLPSPGNPTLQQLRLKRMELMMLQQNASPEAIRKVEEQARMQAQKSPEMVKTLVHEESQAAASQGREKVLIKVQDKAGDIRPFLIFSTDKFEKLFRVYAEVSHVSLANVSFRFDGEQLSASSTPKEHGMEDGELIEVYHKS